MSLKLSLGSLKFQILTALMRIIIAFYPDSVSSLIQREVCEKILNQHCMLLHRYIKKTFGHQANAKFAQVIDAARV